MYGHAYVYSMSNIVFLFFPVCDWGFSFHLFFFQLFSILLRYNPCQHQQITTGTETETATRSSSGGSSSSRNSSKAETSRRRN